MAIRPTKILDFVGLVFCALMKAFWDYKTADFGKFLQIEQKSAAACQRNADFANCRNDRRFCFNVKMLILLITAMQNDTDRHNSNGEYLTFNAKREGKYLLWRDSRRDFTRQDAMRF